MRGQDHFGVSLQAKMDGRQHCPDAGIIRDIEILVQGDVEIHPDKNSLALDIYFIDVLHGNSCETSSRFKVWRWGCEGIFLAETDGFAERDPAALAP